MRFFKKRALAVLMTVCMVLSLLPVSAFAAEDGYDLSLELDGTGITWYAADEAGAEITDGTFNIPTTDIVVDTDGDVPTVFLSTTVYVKANPGYSLGELTELDVKVEGEDKPEDDPKNTLKITATDEGLEYCDLMVTVVFDGYAMEGKSASVALTIDADPAFDLSIEPDGVGVVWYAADKAGAEITDGSFNIPSFDIEIDTTGEVPAVFATATLYAKASPGYSLEDLTKLAIEVEANGKQEGDPTNTLQVTAADEGLEYCDVMVTVTFDGYAIPGSYANIKLTLDAEPTYFVIMVGDEKLDISSFSTESYADAEPIVHAIGYAEGGTTIVVSAYVETPGDGAVLAYPIVDGIAVYDEEPHMGASIFVDVTPENTIDNPVYVAAKYVPNKEGVTGAMPYDEYFKIALYMAPPTPEFKTARANAQQELVYNAQQALVYDEYYKDYFDYQAVFQLNDTYDDIYDGYSCAVYAFEDAEGEIENTYTFSDGRLYIFYEDALDKTECYWVSGVVQDENGNFLAESKQRTEIMVLPYSGDIVVNLDNYCYAEWDDDDFNAVVPEAKRAEAEDALKNTMIYSINFMEAVADYAVEHQSAYDEALARVEFDIPETLPISVTATESIQLGIDGYTNTSYSVAIQPLVEIGVFTGSQEMENYQRWNTWPFAKLSGGNSVIIGVPKTLGEQAWNTAALQEDGEHYIYVKNGTAAAQKSPLVRNEAGDLYLTEIVVEPFSSPAFIVSLTNPDGTGSGGSTGGGYYGGSSDSDPTYSITVPSRVTGGTVKVTPTSASDRQRVTITVKPNTGYELDTLTVTDSKGNTLTLTDQGNNKYTFTMPKGNVSVDAQFQRIEPSVTPVQTVSVNPTNDKLEVDGTAQTPAAYKINDYNYFKLRDIAALLNGTDKQFSVEYGASTGEVTITSGQPYEVTASDLSAPPAGARQATITTNVIYINGAKMELTVYNIDGYNYFKLRDLASALNFYVSWTAERGMFLESDKPYAG